MTFAEHWRMNSRERRKLTILSRSGLVGAYVALVGCANPSGPERVYLTQDGTLVQHHDPVARAVTLQVSDIETALEQFLGPEGDDLILLPNRLDRDQLDYSLDSLLLVDQWLADLHTINRLQSATGQAGESLMRDGRGDNSVTFAGLYLGQVVRLHSPLDWQWQRFDTFLSANPVFTEHYGIEPGLDQFVLVGPQGAATPINSALKRVVHGKEESVHFIGQLLIEEVDLDAGMRGRDLLGMDRRDWPG